MILDSIEMLRAVELLLAIGAAISSLELLHVRDALRDNGLLSWRIHRLSRPLVAQLIHKLGVEMLFRYPGILVLICLRFVSSLAVILCVVMGRPTIAPLVTVIIVTLAFTLRSPEGNDGSDQMSSIALLATTLSEAAGTNFGRFAGLAFIAAQASLAYGTSGFLKITEKGWRNGTFVMDLLKTSSFGHRWLLHLLENRESLATPVGYAIAFGDCAMSCAVFLPPRECIALLCFGVFFHIGIAIVLGLNTFLWSFVATYPAILWGSTHLWVHFDLR
jgi:hypothetical protein